MTTSPAGVLFVTDFGIHTVEVSGYTAYVAMTGAESGTYGISALPNASVVALLDQLTLNGSNSLEILTGGLAGSSTPK